MASVNLKCPWCAESFGIDSLPVGQPVCCPRCRNIFTPPPEGPPVQDLREPVPPPLPADLDHAPPPPVQHLAIPTESESSRVQDSLEPPLPRPPEPFVISTGKHRSGEVHKEASPDRQKSTQRPLRQLNPEERTRRRILRNIIMWGVGASALVVIGAILIRLTRRR
jgi:hypothetical protein